MGDTPCSCQTGPATVVNSFADPGATATLLRNQTPLTQPLRLERYLRAPENRARARVLLAAAPGDLPGTWHSYVTAEGLQTSDGRAMAVDSLTWRDTPLPLRASFEDEGGHWGAVLVGGCDTFERQTVGGMTLIYSEGRFDLDGEHGMEAARLCQAQFLRWVSIDLEVLASEWVYPLGYEDPWDDWWWAGASRAMTAAAGEPYELITEGRICGVTMVDIPAFPQAVIAPSGMALPVVEPMGEAPDIAPHLIAAGFPVAPPVLWTENPNLPGPTPLVVEDAGRVYGHLATWGTCHTGYPGQCVVAPHSKNDYALFRTGTLRCEGGVDVKVGQITLAGGHAPRTASWQQAAVHYDDTRSAVADVAVGEDEYGIWVAGALRPDVTDEQVRALRASPLSGDWRDFGGDLELMAALAVNVPGFPITASAYEVRAGMVGERQVSLVAAGMLRKDPQAKLRERVARLEKLIAVLAPDIVERLTLEVVA